MNVVIFIIKFDSVFSFYVIGTPVQGYSSCISCDWSYAFNHCCYIIIYLEKVNFTSLTIPYLIYQKIF